MEKKNGFLEKIFHFFYDNNEKCYIKMLHSSDNHLAEKHLQRFYDYHSKKRRLKSKKRKSPSEEGCFKFYLFICFLPFRMTIPR